MRLHILVCLACLLFTTSLSYAQDYYIYVWDEYGVLMRGPEPTSETSRTLAAAEQAHGLIGLGCPVEPEIRGSCYGTYFQVYDYFCETDVCTDGSWGYGEGCDSSPGCINIGGYAFGTWDVTNDIDEDGVFDTDDNCLYIANFT